MGIARVAALAAVCVCSLALVADAKADGGGTIATAPLLTPGQTVSGNTTSDPAKIAHKLESMPDCTTDEELWTVNLIAGEQILLRGPTSSPASNFRVEAVPPGVNETALLGTASIAGVQSGSLAEGLSFAAAKSGTWLIVVGPECTYGHDGPYELAATVTPPAFVAGAGGASAISAAPSLTPGVTYSGNTAADGVIAHKLDSLPDCTSDEELWTLNLTAGESVLLRGPTEAPADNFRVQAVPPGVTETQLLGVAPIAGVQSGSLGEGMSFAAARSGTWLIVVGPECVYGHDGPYQIAASVTAPAFPAGAGGGATIATAPLLTPGKTVSGNTAADGVITHKLESLPECTRDEELWTLNLSKGAKVLLKGQTEAPADNFRVEAVPPGVSEPTLIGVAPISHVESGSLSEGVSFTAKTSGMWLIVVGPECVYGHDGPYQLTATVVPLRPSIGSSASALVLSHGFIAVALACKTAPCAGTVELFARTATGHRRHRRHVTVAVASARYSLTAGKSGVVYLRLTPAGRRVLAHARRHHVSARLVIGAAGGTTVLRSVSVS
jgi:hypothetical protein